MVTHLLYLCNQPRLILPWTKVCVNPSLVDRNGVPGQYTEEPRAEQRAEDADSDVEQRTLARMLCMTMLASQPTHQKATIRRMRRVHRARSVYLDPIRSP